MSDYSKPMPVNDIDYAFPARLGELLPPWPLMPADFRNSRTPWNKRFNTLFFGTEEQKQELFASLDVRDGIDEDMATRHLSVITRSLEPRHEHKEAAVAWLMSLWLEPSKKGGPQ